MDTKAQEMYASLKGQAAAVTEGGPSPTGERQQADDAAPRGPDRSLRASARYGGTLETVVRVAMVLLGELDAAEDR